MACLAIPFGWLAGHSRPTRAIEPQIGSDAGGCAFYNRRSHERRRQLYQFNQYRIARLHSSLGIRTH
eukprot:4290439-Pleurochrysis_carterae.AAC.1